MKYVEMRSQKRILQMQMREKSVSVKTVKKKPHRNKFNDVVFVHIKNGRTKNSPLMRVFNKRIFFMGEN